MNVLTLRTSSRNGPSLTPLGWPLSESFESINPAPRTSSLRRLPCAPMTLPIRTGQNAAKGIWISAQSALGVNCSYQRSVRNMLLDVKVAGAVRLHRPASPRRRGGRCRCLAAGT